MYVRDVRLFIFLFLTSDLNEKKYKVNLYQFQNNFSKIFSNKDSAVTYTMRGHADIFSSTGN